MFELTSGVFSLVALMMVWFETFLPKSEGTVIVKFISRISHGPRVIVGLTTWVGQSPSVEILNVVVSVSLSFLSLNVYSLTSP